jgi:hypothetical protein
MARTDAIDVRSSQIIETFSRIGKPWRVAVQLVLLGTAFSQSACLTDQGQKRLGDALVGALVTSLEGDAGEGLEAGDQEAAAPSSSDQSSSSSAVDLPIDDLPTNENQLGLEGDSSENAPQADYVDPTDEVEDTSDSAASDTPGRPSRPEVGSRDPSAPATPARRREGTVVVPATPASAQPSSRPASPQETAPKSVKRRDHRSK